MRPENLKAHRAMLTLAALALLALTPESALAYAGPGSGLTVIGAAVAFIGAILLAIVGFIWYPIKRLLRRRSARPAKTSAVADTPAPLT